MSSAPATEFPRFLELPFEIRWAIYELCLPTRVVEGDVRDLKAVRKENMIRKEQTALKQIVAKFSRTPVIARASSEVYRAIQRHVVAPPHGEWVWNRDDWGEIGFTDSRPLYFDPKSDVLCYAPGDHDYFDGFGDCLEKSPIWLAEGRNVTLALDMEAVTSFTNCKRLAEHCLLGRKKCIIILEETTVIEPVEWIESCGLFGLFGEERTVLVDVDDLDRVDFFDRRLNGKNIVPGEEYMIERIGTTGLRRYSSHSTVNSWTAWYEDSPVVSAEERAQTIEMDKNEIISHLRELWLEVNDCFKGSELNNPSFVPFEGEDWDRVFNEEHPNARPWYDNLPAFSFAVRVHAYDLEEGAKMASARKARKRYNRLASEILAEWIGE